MAIIGVSITKRNQWEGSQEEFSNVYHYSSDTSGGDIIFDGISDSDAVSLCNIIADLERPLHSNQTDFVRARVWGPVDAPPADNQTIAKVDLSGPGEHSEDGEACLEDTILVRMRTGRLSVRDRPVWLRKWFRTMGSPSATGGDFRAGVHARSETLGESTQQAVADAAMEMVAINLVELTSFPDRLILVSPSGRQLTDYDNPTMEVYPYLQTHDVKY